VFLPALLPSRFVARCSTSPLALANRSERPESLPSTMLVQRSAALSGTDGTYDLRIPAPRDSSGAIRNYKFTLRADAAGYQSFPGGLRPAIPSDVNTAVQSGTSQIITNPSTSIGLIALPTAQRATITGKVVAPLHAGVLVVGGGSSAISDLDGSFVRFNVTPGSVTVKGFAAGQPLTPATVTVAPSAQAEVVITASSTPLSRVSGSLSLVNAGGISSTSVVLIVKDTFSLTLERGETPRGLRKTGVWLGRTNVVLVPWPGK